MVKRNGLRWSKRMIWGIGFGRGNATTLRGFSSFPPLGDFVVEILPWDGCTCGRMQTYGSSNTFGLSLVRFHCRLLFFRPCRLGLAASLRMTLTPKHVSTSAVRNYDKRFTTLNSRAAFSALRSPPLQLLPSLSN